MKTLKHIWPVESTEVIYEWGTSVTTDSQSVQVDDQRRRSLEVLEERRSKEEAPLFDQNN